VCVPGDASSLSQENRALKAQLERLMSERDDLRGKVCCRLHVVLQLLVSCDSRGAAQESTSSWGRR
jgi:hypothetical protein